MNDLRDSALGHTVAASHLELNRRIAKLFFGIGCCIAFVGAALYTSVEMQLQPGMKHLLVGACLLLGAGFGVAMVAVRGGPLGRLVLVMGWCGAAMVLLLAVALGEGLHSLTLGYLGLLVCLMTVLTSIRAGMLLALGCAVGIGLMAEAEHRGVLPGATAVLRNPNLLNLTTHALVLLGAVMTGSMMARMVQRSTSEAAEREQRFRTLLSLAADWYWELDADLRFSRIASPHPEGSRADVDARLGKHPWEVDDMTVDPVAQRLNREDMQARRPFTDLQVRMHLPSGRTLHYSMTGQPRFDAEGRFTGYWGVSRDVSAEVNAREAHSASEFRYRELFALSATPLVLHRDGKVLHANEAAARLFGFTSADAMNGFELMNLHPTSHHAIVARRMRESARQPIGQSLQKVELPVNAIDGRRIVIQGNMVRVHTSDGSAALSHYHDITERVATESALRRSQAMLSHLFATSPDFITLSEMDSGKYVMVNDSFTRMFGYDADEVVGRSSLELGIWVRPGDRERMVADLIAQGGVNETETLFFHKSGRMVTLLMSAGRFSMDGRDYLVVNGRDVTETQRTRLEHEAILKHASIGIAFTRDRLFMQANPLFERMFGWEPGELIGQHGSAVWAGDADYAELTLTVGPMLAEGKLVELERQMRRRDGTLFWCRMLAQVVDPSHPSMGGTIWICEDVTERHQIEQALAAARDVAEAASRAKSSFLANTSHEIRTPLNGLLGLARLALQPTLEAPRRQQYLEQILDSAQSLAGIISDILDVSKIEAGKLSIEAVPFDLHGLLHAVHHAYLSLAQARSLEFNLSVADDVPATVRGDPVRLRQILSNYITNGLKFTTRGGVHIEVSASADGATPHHVRFSVSDTGPGVDASTQLRLFQPFVQADDSTTRRFGGTGLGLSICKELAELMGGEVGMDSRPGEGSCFWAEVPLPPTDAPLLDPVTEAHDTERLAGMRVLLVEDNAVNMMIGVAMLEQWGVEVTQAVDGHECVLAVEKADAAERPFDVVLMDVQMPRLSGHEAARRLRRFYSADELPIIALTAAALVSEREEALKAGMNDFLTKPIDSHRLRGTLIRSLD